jgi:uncharacterized repeat protein (TIGR01451 family)
MPRIAEIGDKNRLASAPTKAKESSTGACVFHIMALLGAVLLLSLCMTGYAMDYYSGHQYTFSTPYNSNWEYSWYASCCSDSTQPCCYEPTKINGNTFIFTAPIVDKPTEITISVVVRDKALPTCMDMGELKIIIKPLAGISIVKNHLGGDGIFPFEGIGFLPGGGITSFSLGPTNDYSFAWASLNPGTYSITELVPDGWDLDTITVTGTDASNYQITGNKITIAYQADESPVITFTDKKRSSLTITKSTLVGDDTFNFIGTGFKTGDALESFRLMNGQSVSDQSLNPEMAHTITEVTLDGWDLSGITITGTDAANYKITGSSITITPQPGESIVVTFTNTKKGSIIVDKVTSPADDIQSFDFIGSWGGTSGTKFSLTDTATPYESGYLVPGDYVVCESALPNGWTLTGISVAGAESYLYGDGTNWHASFDASTDTCVKITLGAGQNPVVTFIDTKQGSITVTKTTIDGDDTFSFTGSDEFDACILRSFSLSNGQSASCPYLAHGTYTVTEKELAGWDLTDLAIDDPDGGSSVDIDTMTATIDLDPGESITVTFTNRKQPTECNLELNKTTLNATAKRGEDIYYLIKLCNNCTGEVSFKNVTLWDVLPRGVELISVYPEPTSSTSTKSTLTWFFDEFSPGCFYAEIVVRVPIVDINYDMTQGVQGEGFVNVHNDYDTHQGPESVLNCAYARADLVETISSCASSRIVDPGTELKRREFGSGTYKSEEVTKIRTENKSIKSVTSLSAVHKPTTFALPRGGSIAYGTKWTEKSEGINTITGATMNEEYTFANKIEKNRSIELDKNGSTMKTEVEFEGTGHIGVLKKEAPDSHPKVKPTYEGVEDYVGSFKVYEMVDEYGSSVQSNKSVTGYGYVAVDKRLKDSQRTYESGTGSYQIDEIIDTPTNYIAKDINLVHGPTNYSYTSDVAVSQDMKWGEGVWSKSGLLRGGDIFKDPSNCGVPVNKAVNGSPPASYIRERYSSLDNLKKESIASGLNEMNTNASFSGMADYSVKSVGDNHTDKIVNEERYVGQYDIARKVLITGMSKYDRPHITVTKEGNFTTKWFNKTNAQVADYVITITNDGNRSLAPIYIRDIFPPGTEYIGSSIRPSSLTLSEVSWSIPVLSVGSSLEIDMELNITEYAPANVVNRAQVCGMDGDECIAAAAYSTLESGSLTCCPTKVLVSKRAWLDAVDPTNVHYSIVVANNAPDNVAVTVTDQLPGGMTLLNASISPNTDATGHIIWILPEIISGKTKVIDYMTKASRDGGYSSTVHIDATAINGMGYNARDATAYIVVTGTGNAPRTFRYGGWEPPNWNLTSPEGESFDAIIDSFILEVEDTESNNREAE